MNIEKKCLDSINEAYYKCNINGMDVYVLPKKLTTLYAVIGVNFGASDVEYEVNGKRVEIPQGAAHFLEHKMFEDTEGNDAFEAFTALGANANAFTTSSNTCYMFSCSDRFDEGLKLLIETVQTPHFTDESTEREKSIISKEIAMYRDDVYWNLFYDMLCAMYENDPVKNDPAGTDETIAEITPQVLYDLHRCFYTPENMALCVCGDIEPQRVFDIAQKTIISGDKMPKRLTPHEPTAICESYTEKFMDVAMPIFGIGIKHTPDDNTVAREVENEIILQTVFGKSALLYNSCYEEGLLGDRFSAAFTGERGAAFTMITGSSPDPHKVYERVLEEIDKRMEDFCTAEEFDRAKKVCYSAALDTFNSTEGVANTFLSFSFDGGDLFEYMEKLRSADYNKVKQRFKTQYNKENISFSVIYPKEEKK